MDEHQTMDIILIVLSFSIIAGWYAIKRIGDLVKGYSESFGKEVGKLDATKVRLDEIHEQLAQSVKISESIKSDIQHGAWRVREIELLKREKLEQYLLHLYQVEEELTIKMRNRYFYENEDFDELAQSRLSMIQELYFPELEEVHLKFISATTEFSDWYILGCQELIEKRKDGDSKPIISEKHMNVFPKKLAVISNAKLEVTSKTKEISMKLNVA